MDDALRVDVVQTLADIGEPGGRTLLVDATAARLVKGRRHAVRREDEIHREVRRARLLVDNEVMDPHDPWMRHPCEGPPLCEEERLPLLRMARYVHKHLERAPDAERFVFRLIDAAHAAAERTHHAVSAQHVARLDFALHTVPAVLIPHPSPPPACEQCSFPVPFLQFGRWWNC